MSGKFGENGPVREFGEVTTPQYVSHSKLEVYIKNLKGELNLLVMIMKVLSIFTVGERESMFMTLGL